MVQLPWRSRTAIGAGAESTGILPPLYQGRKQLCNICLSWYFLFLLEIVQGETVITYNICDEGFDFIDEVNKHIADAHEDKMNHILTRVVDKGEGDSEETKTM